VTETCGRFLDWHARRDPHAANLALREINIYTRQTALRHGTALITVVHKKQHRFRPDRICQMSTNFNKTSPLYRSACFVLCSSAPQFCLFQYPIFRFLFFSDLHFTIDTLASVTYFSRLRLSTRIARITSNARCWLFIPRMS